MKYALSFRWVKFAGIAMMATLVLAIPIIGALIAIGRPDLTAFAVFAAYAPCAIWYLRRYIRDKKEFDASQG